MTTPIYPTGIEERLRLGEDSSTEFKSVVARISVVRLAGTHPTGEFLDRHEIGGRLADQLAGAVEFLSRHFASPSRVEGWERKELGIQAGHFQVTLWGTPR
ncbi:MAG: hypothetical protein HY712_00095 [candidate division NC10 bacterium]|nr:hypothetical protein [candidate division NC10 bacterium]